jgi:peroxiredoxin Q/BCP
MKLKVGDLAPDFELQSVNGGTFHLKEHLGNGGFVLYFYPKDFTPGCTSEACGFRDEYAELVKAGIQVYGISTDPIESHKRFIKEYRLPFELLSDVDGRVARLYGVYNRLFKVANRVTFVIDDSGTILNITKNLFFPKTHIIAVKTNIGK